MLPKKSIFPMLSSILLLSCSSHPVAHGESLPFPDITSNYSWAIPAISELKSLNIVNGYSDGNFHPQDTVTRAQFAAMIAGGLHLPGDAAVTFADSTTSFARGAIGALKRAGDVQGDGTLFGPDRTISRAEVAQMIQNILHLPNASTDAYSDVNGHWAANAIGAVSHAGIMHGDGGLSATFRPNDSMTRAEAAAVIDNLIHVMPENTTYVSHTNQVLGFTAVDYTGDNYSTLSLETNATHLTSIASFSFRLSNDQSGHLIGQAPADEVSFANLHGITSEVLINNYNESSSRFDGTVANQVLQDPAARQVLEQSIVNTAAQNSYHGVNIDFEMLPASASSVFTQFLSELHTLLAAKGLQLSVDVPSKTSVETWDQAYNYSAIGAVVDQVIPMAYDYNWPNGPIAPIQWVDQVLQYATSQIPANKILLGIADYGYDTNQQTNRVKVVLEKSVNQLIAKYGGSATLDPTTDEMTYSYTDSYGDTHQVWFESAINAKDRKDLATTYGVAGIAIWRLGFEDSTFWNEISKG